MKQRPAVQLPIVSSQRFWNRCLASREYRPAPAVILENRVPMARGFLLVVQARRSPRGTGGDEPDLLVCVRSAAVRGEPAVPNHDGRRAPQPSAGAITRLCRLSTVSTR